MAVWRGLKQPYNKRFSNRGAMKVGDQKIAQKQLLDKAWSELSDKEQTDMLEKVELPSNIYRSFHRAMSTGGNKIPEPFKERYQEAMSKQSRKGVSTGKVSELQNLCRMWLMEVMAWTGDPDAERAPPLMEWNQGYLEKRSWVSHVQKTKKIQKLYTWGIVVGKHYGEENAIAALARNEVAKVRNPDWEGALDKLNPKFMYKIKSQEGH